MTSFACDYMEGCHEEILRALTETNRTQQPGYGADACCASARDKIRSACRCPDADIWFVNGGTQANQLVIDTMLAPYEGVISATSGHVNTHEAGAIEFAGHKVLALPAHDGKLDSGELSDYLRASRADLSREHMVFPGMVYISHPTEYGTLYTADELARLSDICKQYEIPLYLDGARLAYGLQARGTDVSLPMIAARCDVFYIGGTKCGALCGEAIVFTQQNTPSHFLTRIKQHGALSAKGRLFGIQFDTLFSNDLYADIGRHAIDMAEQMKAIFREHHIPFYLESPTNQQFVILENSQMEALSRQVGFEIWEPYGENRTVVRFATSWATTREQLDDLRQALAADAR